MAAQQRHFNTQGIILSRTDYGEADRIITFITPGHGKVRAIAKGVRKSGAKLAGALELFSVSELTFAAGRGETHTITSARLSRHYGHIVKSLERTNAAYELIRLLNRATEDKPEQAYFELLNKTLAGLDGASINPAVTDLWFKLQLLKLGGHAPQLKNDINGNKLLQSKAYVFDTDKMCFNRSASGDYSSEQIKFLRLGFAAASPRVVQRVRGADELAQTLQPLAQTLLANFVRL